ncbi:MAG TPA: hypothetical protein VM658_13910 [bacterium]|nr:hypothetical protein [bacterium]
MTGPELNHDPAGARARRIRLIAYAFAFGMAAVNVLVQIVFINKVGRADWDQFATLHLIQQWNHHYFGFAKHWNPLMGGGMSLGGDPQVPVFSLSMLIAYLLGPVTGIRVSVMLWSVFGFIGAYLFSGLFFKERPLRWLAAGLFVGNGFFITHISNGHIEHLPAFGMPFYLWYLHKTDGSLRASEGWARKIGLALFCGLALAPLGVICMDGSPIFPLYFFPWLLAYAAFLAVQQRTLWPVIVLGLSLCAALCLDAIYALPVAGYSFDFPRAGQAAFHNPLALPLYLIVPMQGSPGPLFGFPDSAQEYSLYIGPVLLYLLYRYRARLREFLPAPDSRRFLWLSAAFFVIGLGSLRSSGISWLYSPFDLLALAPGFRSIKNTSRYWGFMVLPLSLLSAQTVWWFLNEREAFTKNFRAALIVLFFLFQFAFQIGALSQWLYGSTTLRRFDLSSYLFRTSKNPDAPGVAIDIEYGKKFRMTATIAPDSGIINCYQNMEYPQGRIEPGAELVQAVIGAERASEELTRKFQARWLTFNDIRISFPPLADLPPPGYGGMITVVLNQNYYRYWSASSCETYETGSGNLGLLICDGDIGPEVTLSYRDPWSELGQKISRASAPAYLILLFLSGIFWMVTRKWTAAS